MNIRRSVSSVAAAVILGTATLTTPAAAQQASDCGQLAETGGGNTFTYNDPGRQNSGAVLIGLINAAISNVEADVVALNNVDLLANVSVVCVSDSLNNNHLEILKNINVDVIENSDVAVLNDVNILAVDFGNNTVYIAPQDFDVGTQ